MTPLPLTLTAHPKSLNILKELSQEFGKTLHHTESCYLRVNSMDVLIVEEEDYAENLSSPGEPFRSTDDDTYETNNGSESEFESDSDSDSDSSDEFRLKGEKWIGHYSSNQRILLVGEGDFSFALCLARSFGFTRNMVATSLDSQDDLAKKYSNGLENVRELEERGCLVLHGVDAKKMSQHFFLRTQRFDRVVYNFPHVGFLYPEGSYCQIQLNKELVVGFIMNGKSLLRKDTGEIHITHKEGEPYDKWNIIKKAEKRGLVLVETVPFYKSNYPCYDNKRAHGYRSNDPFHLGCCSTYKFKLDRPPTAKLSSE